MRRLGVGLVLAALTSVFAAMPGCRSDASESTPTNSCSEFTSAYCAKLAACSPLELRYNYGDEATCARRNGLTCLPLAELPGTSWTPAKINACARATAASSCFATVGMLPECMPSAGSLPVGGKCADSSQCSTSFCNTAAAPTPEDGGLYCGTCEVPPRPPLTGCGDAGACLAPEFCLRDDTGVDRCRRLPQEGEACALSFVPACELGLTCIASVCSRPKGAGATCTEFGECDLSKSLLCIESTCQTPTWVQPGSPCGVGQLCSGGECVSEGVDPNSPATCMAWAADGSPCDQFKGPPCLAPAFCLSGKCQIVDTVCRIR
jgi:hypothetical protein